MMMMMMGSVFAVRTVHVASSILLFKGLRVEHGWTKGGTLNGYIPSCIDNNIAFLLPQLPWEDTVFIYSLRINIMFLCLINDSKIFNTLYLKLF